jgi:hypothetical protein
VAAPDITESIPVSLSRAGARAADESRDKAFNIGIAGMGFELRANGQHPYMREADQVRKDQFDASDQAGEQSLGTWWRRSQDDWSLGEGTEWYEPGVREESQFRYFEGQGVDPWTQGRMTLLHQVEESVAVETGAPVYLSTYRQDGEDGYVVASGDEISFHGTAINGSVRTNHSVLPRMTNRNADGTLDNVTYSNTTTGRLIEVTGLTGKPSFNIASTDASSPHPVAGLPEVFTVSGYFKRESTVGTSTYFVEFMIRFFDEDTEISRVESGVRDLGVGEELRLSLPSVTVPAGATGYQILFAMRGKSNNGNFAAGDGVRVGRILIEEGTFLRPYFDGGTTDTSTVDYAWSGSANVSKSTATVSAQPALTLASSGLTQPMVGNGRVYYGRDGAAAFVTPGGTETVVAITSGPTRVWWVKSRLFVADGQNLYWLNHNANDQDPGTDGILVANGGDGWTWVDVADTPDAILLAGHDGTNSYVYSVTVESESGEGLPTFTGAAEVARLPYGERITCMGTYLGTYVALGTTLGIRIGLIGQAGRVQYGPVLKRLDGVEDVSFYDSFAYFSVTAGHPDGSSGLWRIDLSTEIGDTGRNPYASDLYAPSGGAATSVAFLGGTGRPLFVAGSSVYIQSDAFLEQGWFTNGKVRFRTTAAKDFQHLTVSGSLNGGTFDHRAIVPGSTAEHRVAVQTAATGLPLASLDVQGGPLFEWMQVKTYITSDAVRSPEVTSWMLAAIPQPERSRLIRLPLQVWDEESVGQPGMKVGYRGFAFDRVTALEALEDSGRPVVVVDERTGETFTASIETVQFVGVDNSDRGHMNFGGWLDVTVRKRS